MRAVEIVLRFVVAPSVLTLFVAKVRGHWCLRVQIGLPVDLGLSGLLALIRLLWLAGGWNRRWGRIVVRWRLLGGLIGYFSPSLVSLVDNALKGLSEWHIGWDSRIISRYRCMDVKVLVVV